MSIRSNGLLYQVYRHCELEILQARIKFDKTKTISTWLIKSKLMLSYQYLKILHYHVITIHEQVL